MINLNVPPARWNLNFAARANRGGTFDEVRKGTSVSRVLSPCFKEGETVVNGI